MSERSGVATPAVDEEMLWPPNQKVHVISVPRWLGALLGLGILAAVGLLAWLLVEQRATTQEIRNLEGIIQSK